MEQDEKLSCYILYIESMRVVVMRVMVSIMDDALCQPVVQYFMLIRLSLG